MTAAEVVEWMAAQGHVVTVAQVTSIRGLDIDEWSVPVLPLPTPASVPSPVVPAPAEGGADGAVGVARASATPACLPAAPPEAAFGYWGSALHFWSKQLREAR